MALSAQTHRLPIGDSLLDTGEWHDVHSPWSGDVVSRVAWGGAKETRSAIDAAQARLEEAGLPAHERAAILQRARDLLVEREEEFARSICAESGKPIETARIEARRAVSTFQAAATEARTLTGELVPMEGDPTGHGKLAFTLRVPVGVVGAISPFNFPLNLVAHKVAPAIAAGCPVVLKPASQTPGAALLLATLLRDAGLPAGWYNVVCGPAGDIGGVLASDERVRLITFTGSSAIGWKLREQAPTKYVNLELGNSTPVIIAPDADPDLIDAVAAAGFQYAGQTCVSVQRIYAHASIHDEVVRRCVAVAESLVVGAPSEDDTDVGPVIDRDAHERILDWIGEAQRSGATVACGGTDAGHNAIAPTVLTGVTDDMQVACAEVFGPVVSILRYDDLDDAIERANGTPYGLQAAIISSSIDTALTAATRLEFGSVLVNEVPSFRSDPMPYGGVKQSGNTKEGPRWAVRSMTEERLVVLPLPGRS